jgi:carbamoyl-phosphate synthase small subunit
MSAILALETGHVFHGDSVGITGSSVGELVFNTAMTGYQEILTDPSYKEQIITFTYPHIGNTGVNPADMQSSQVHAAGLVVKSLAKFTSSWRATQSLQEFLIKQQVVAISGIDTRGLTKIIRAHGALRACITALPESDANSALNMARDTRQMRGMDLTQQASTAVLKVINPDSKLHVVLLDFGVKQNIIACLQQVNLKISVIPGDTPAEQVLALKPHGILLSNGPGDPAACTQIIENIKKLLKIEIPIFGICLGHQLLALALQARTYKMQFGHHGSNHPVKDLKNSRVLITSQNHGFAVAADSLNNEIEITYCSLFDGSIQGIRHKSLPYFSFQGHPEAAPGPHDALYMFDDFLNAIREYDAKTR